jgi:3-oxoacyl-(acyl-carrier-protein) synthase
VCSSASGLPRYDVAELHAIERLFGTDVAVVAPKSLFGEAFAGSAALGLAAAVAWVEGTAPAPLIAGIAPPRVDVVVVTAVGYYGNASAVVVKRS